MVQIRVKILMGGIDSCLFELQASVLLYIYSWVVLKYFWGGFNALTSIADLQGHLGLYVL